jgi:hypothetical protein
MKSSLIGGRPTRLSGCHHLTDTIIAGFEAEDDYCHGSVQSHQPCQPENSPTVLCTCLQMCTRLPVASISHLVSHFTLQIVYGIEPV